MLQVTCPISRVRWAMPYHTSTTGEARPVQLAALHPLLQAQLPELNSLPLPHKDSELVLMFCAYLQQLASHKKLQWRTGLPVSNFSGRWLAQIIPQVAHVANWLALNSGTSLASSLPAFAVTQDTDKMNLQTWLTDCATLIAGSTAMPSHEVRHKSGAMMRFGKELNSDSGYDAAAEKFETPEATQLRKLRGLHKFVARTLLNLLAIEVINEEKKDLILKVVQRPKTYTSSMLRRVKLFCLEFLPEATLEDKNDKDLVCMLLDQAILEKQSVAQLLNGEDDADIASLISGPAQRFTILGQPAPEPAEELPAMTAAPVRSQYANQLAYLLDLKRWNRQQRGA